MLETSVHIFQSFYDGKINIINKPNNYHCVPILRDSTTVSFETIPILVLKWEWSGWQIWLKIKIIFFTAMWELDYLEKCGSSNPDFKEVGCLWKVIGFSISPCIIT